MSDPVKRFHDFVREVCGFGTPDMPAGPLKIPPHDALKSALDGHHANRLITESGCQPPNPMGDR